MNSALNKNLNSLDKFFDSCLAESFIYKLIIGLFNLIQNYLVKNFNFLVKPVYFLNSLTLCFLTICLGLPQLANDKGYFGIIIIIGLGLSLIYKVLEKNSKFKFNVLDALVVTYFLANVIATFASAYFKESLFGLAKLVVYLFCYFWFRLSFSFNLKLKTLIMNSLIFLASLMSLYGLYQYKIHVKPLATWEDPSLEIHQTRVFSTLGNPNLLAGFLLPVFFISLAYCFNYLTRKKFFTSFIYGFISIIIGLTILFTGSRGAYLCLPICFILGLATVLITWVKKFSLKKIILIASLTLFTIGLGGVIILKIPYFSDRFSTIFAGRAHSSNSYRINVWESSLNMLKDNYIFGIGPGNKTFRLAYGLYMKSGFDALGTYCVPLEIAVESGVLGFTAFYAFVLYWFMRLHVYFWNYVNDNGKINFKLLGLALAMLSMLIHGLVDTVFLRPQIQIIFWLLISILVE